MWLRKLYIFFFDVFYVKILVNDLKIEIISKTLLNFT